jgi:hypothetical protein
MLNRSIIAAGIGLLMSAAAAQAAPITTPPPALNAFGDITAVYIFANAADTSILNELTPDSIARIFCNHNDAGPPACTAGASGDTMDLGNQNGNMTFSLENVTRSTTFVSDVADSDGNYHAKVTTDYSEFGVGALPAAAAAALAGLSNITYIGWEDKNLAQGSDFDYNDLIFAFANTRITTQIPEPLTLSLFGAGLAGAALVGRRRSKKAKA